MLKRNIYDVVNNIVKTAILCLSLLWIASYFAIIFAPETGFYTYANYWYPLISTLEKVVFTVILGWKVLTFSSCLITKISVALFAICTIISLIVALTNMDFYLSLNLCAISMFVAVVLVLISWILPKVIKCRTE